MKRQFISIAVAPQKALHVRQIIFLLDLSPNVLVALVTFEGSRYAFHLTRYEQARRDHRLQLAILQLFALFHTLEEIIGALNNGLWQVQL